MTDDSEISLGDTVLAVGPPPGTDEAAAIEALRRAVRAPDPIVIGGAVVDERYVLHAELGRGGMGVVWQARDRRLGRDVALKLLTGRVTNERLARMRREAQAIAQLAHPNVVPVYDVGLHGARPYLVMELVRGQELGAWMRSEPPRPWRTVVAAFVAAGEGLIAAHDAGLVHRDFKPANVLMGEDGRPRVVDFGLARDRDDSPSHPQSVPVLTDGSLTLTGVAVGTPAYMAPEQHEGHDATAATDTFGFAVSLFEGLYGERPFAGPDLVSLFDAKRDGPPRAPPSSVPRAVYEAVARGLAPKPAERWASMRAFVTALQRATRPRRTAAIGVAAVALGGIAWLGWPAPPQVRACAQRVRSFRTELDVRTAALRDQLSAAHVSDPLKAATDAVLADYAAAWEDAAAAACDPARPSEAVPASRVDDCLDRSAAALFRRLDAATQSPDAAAAFDQALDHLPDANDCTDRLLANRQPLPDDARARQRIEQLRAWAVRPRDTDEAIALLDEVPNRLAEARALGHAPTTAAIALEAAVWSQNNGQYDASHGYCREAHALAVEGGADRIAMRAANECVTATAWLGELSAARQWDRQAQALRQRVDEAPLSRVGARADLAMALRVANETDEARLLSAEVYQEALALPWHDRHSIHAFVTLATVSIWLNEWDAALQRLQASVQRAEQYYPGNGDAVVPAEAQLATVYRYLDRPDDAERTYRRVLTRKIPEGLRLQTELNLALFIAEDRQRGEEARALVAAAEQRVAAAGKTDTLEMGAVWVARGHVARKQGDAEPARTAYHRARSIYERHLEPDHVRLVDIEQSLAKLPAAAPSGAGPGP